MRVESQLETGTCPVCLLRVREEGVDQWIHDDGSRVCFQATSAGSLADCKFEVGHRFDHPTLGGVTVQAIVGRQEVPALVGARIVMVKVTTLKVRPDGWKRLTVTLDVRDEPAGDA